MVGATLSKIVTVVVTELVFPLASVTVKVTSLAPKSLQSNDVLLMAIEGVPQLSVDPLLTMLAVTVTLPELSKFNVMF